MTVAPTTTPPSPQPEAGTRLLGPAYAATTIGMFALIAFVAFEAMAVTTVMPTVARELDGVGLYALTFAAPLASGVVGMVAAGMWSDRRGPVDAAAGGAGAVLARPAWSAAPRRRWRCWSPAGCSRGSAAAR